MDSRLSAPDAERAVVAAAILTSGQSLEESACEPGQFAHAKFAKLFAAAKMLYSRDGTVDPILLAEESGIDAGEIADLAAGCPTASNVSLYAKIVKDWSVRREALRELEEARSALLAGGGTADEPLDRLGTGLARISESLPTGGTDFNSVLHSAVDHIERAAGGEPPSGVTTGLVTLDNSLAFGGLPLAQVTTIAAATSTGKSALANHMLGASLEAGSPAVCCSLEDSAKSYVIRMLSSRTGVDNARLQRGNVSKEELASVMAEAGKLHGAPCEFIDRVPPSVDELCGMLRRAVRRLGARLLIIDYLQLIRAGQSFQKTQERVDYVFGAIVNMALALEGCATLLVSQLRRTRGRRPTVEDLYHSGMLEQGSNTILLLWRPPINLPCACCDIAKQKNGVVGMRYLGWSPRTSSFFDPRQSLVDQYESALKEYERNAPSDY